MPIGAGDDRSGIAPWLRRFTLTAALLLWSAVLTAAPASRQALADEYADWFNLRTTQEDIVGAAFVVVSREGILRVGTVGHTDTGRKKRISADTAFRIASVSKTFAAGLTAQLVSEGGLQWDDPVTRYVPDFRVQGDASRIRIRDLLGQSSGLIPHAYDNLIEAGAPVEEVQRRLAELPFICPPGDCYSYQNSVFSLIQPVVEKVAADSYAHLIEQRIFRPLGMHTASVGFDAFLATGDRAEPHVKRNGRWTTVSVLPNYYRVGPAAGVNASATDMGKWLMAQLGSSPAVVSAAAVTVQITPGVKTPGELHRREWKRILTDAHYGLGWRVYQISGEQIAYHSGWVSGYRADAAWSAGHNVGIAILMNAESPSISALTTHFWEMAFARLGKGELMTSP